MVHAHGKRLELAGWVWVVGKHARVRSSIYMYFMGGENVCMSVGGNGREISTTVNMGLNLKRI
jgi:hypothetical protein